MNRLAHAGAVAALLAAHPLAAQTPGARVLPPASGQYAVGRAQFFWTDVSRTDTANASGHREIVGWVWYPAATGTNVVRAAWMPGKLADLFWKDFVSKNPGTAATPAPPIESFRTNARDNALFATAQPSYPVLIFAPGLGSHPLEYSNLIEDIVSHGYVAVGVTPTYYSGFTILADGRVPSQRPFGNVVTPGPTTTQDQLAEMFAAAKAQVIDVQSTWAGDISFALDVLARESGDSPTVLRGRLDLGRVGVLGHSLGGIAALQAARTDRRLRAIVSLDGAGIGGPAVQLASPVTNELPLEQPVLMISAGIGMRDYATALRGASRATHIRLLGAAHPFPTDLGVLPLPASVASAGATIDAARALAVTKAYALAFFDQHLRGVSSELLAGRSASYPEIVFVPVGR